MNPLPHLLVADAVWRRLQWPAGTRGHLLAGSVAPDAHRVSPDIGFRRSHFRLRRETGNRPRDLLNEYVRPALLVGSAEEQGFWLGWLSHVTSDALWRRMLRDHLPGLWHGCTRGEQERRQLLRAQYRDACDTVDREIADAEPRLMDELRWVLRTTHRAYDVFPLTPQQLDEWIAVVLASHLPPDVPESRGNDVIYRAFVQHVMDGAVEESLVLIYTELDRAAQELGTSEDLG